MWKSNRMFNLSYLPQENIPIIDISGDEPEVQLVAYFKSCTSTAKPKRKCPACRRGQPGPCPFKHKPAIPALKAGNKRTSPKANR